MLETESMKFLFGNPGKLWKRNLFAVSVMIAFLAGSYRFNLQSYEAATGFEEAINISGRQRMLSQRTLYLASELNSGNFEVKQKLASTVSLFKASNEALATASTLNAVTELPPSIKQHYWGASPNTGLYQESLDFVQAAELYLASQNTSGESWEALNLFGESQLLENLDYAVKLFEESALERTTNLIEGQKYNLLVGSFILALMALFIFWPSHIAIDSGFRKLKKSNKKLKKQKKVALAFGEKAEFHALISERERDRAIESDRHKSEFLATVGHEIRTPLNGVLGMMELLSIEPLSKSQKSKVETASISAHALLRIINDILDYSKLEQDNIHLDYSTFDVRQLCSQTVNQLNSNALSNGNTLTVCVDKNVPPDFVSDRNRVAKTLYNLVDNAIKFTSDGTIHVQAEITKVDSVKTLVFSVSDDGIGIDEADIAGIFDHFIQIQSSLNRSFGGNGLGLAICKKNAELLGGTIEVESEINSGSVFRFSVPLGIITQESQPVKPKANLKASKLSILVAEDNETNQLLIKSMLKKLGHEVTIANNGQQAVEKMLPGKFDVVLMDIQMPIMDGIKATQIIRSRQANLPIYAVTANSEALTEVEQERIGLNGCLPKPVSLKGLENLIEQSSE